MNAFAYVGVCGGALCGLFGWWLGRYFARKNRGLDELYEAIWQKARGRSWIVTLFAIYLFFTLTLSGVAMSAMMMLSLLLLIHVGSWAVLGLYYNWRLRGWPEREVGVGSSSGTLIAILIGVGVVVLFLIVAMATNNWKFFWFSLPPALLSTMISLFSNKQKQRGK